MDRRTVIPCYSTHHTQAWRYRGLWTDGQSYLAIAHTTLRDTWTDGHSYLTIEAWRYRGLWTDGQSYLAIAHTTLRPGDTEGYGQTDSHTLL